MREPLEFYSLLPKLKQGASIQKTPHAIPACRKFRLRLQLAEHGRLIPRNFVSTRGEREELLKIPEEKLMNHASGNLHMCFREISLSLIAQHVLSAGFRRKKIDR